MALLDMPPESFKWIVGGFVAKAGVEGAWNCVAFVETSEHILSASPKEAFASHQALHILRKNFAYYLAYRRKNAQDVFPELPAKVSKMAKYLQEKLGIKTDAERWKLLTQLCKGLVPNIRPHRSKMSQLALLWNMPSYFYGHRYDYPRKVFDRRKLKKDLNYADRVTAACAVANVPLVMKALAQLPDHATFHIFGLSIVNAVRMRNTALLSAIMDVLLLKKTKGAKRSLVQSFPAFGAPDAIFEAITTRQVETLRQLLGYLQTHVSRPGQEMYQDFIEHAIDSTDAGCLRAILAAVPNEQAGKEFVVKLPLFLYACYEDHAESVKALVVDGGFEINSVNIKQSPIFKAIRSGENSVLGVVIDAGADVNLAAYADPMRTTITPLEYAIRIKKVNAVPYLLSRGADIPPMSEWPVHPKMYKALREQKMIRGGRNVLAFGDFKAMSDAALAAL